MSFSNHADSFYSGYKRERVSASKPNAGGSSYRLPDQSRVSDMVLSGLGDDATQPAISTTSATTATTTPGAAAVTATGGSLIDTIKNNQALSLLAAIAGLVVIAKIVR